LSLHEKYYKKIKRNGEPRQTYVKKINK